MLPHFASRLFGTPLLVPRAKLDVILAVMGERLGLAVPAADLALPVPKPATATPAGIAVIPVHGTLVKRSLGLEAASGLTSYGEIAADNARADDLGLVFDSDPRYDQPMPATTPPPSASAGTATDLSTESSVE